MMLNISFIVRTNNSILSVFPYSDTAVNNVNLSYYFIVSQSDCQKGGDKYVSWILVTPLILPCSDSKPYKSTIASSTC